MKLARVVGNVVSTIKHKDHEGLKLLIVQEIDRFGKPYGKQQIAVDAACAGEGDYVIVSADGGASRIIVGDGRQVVDWVIVGVLDSISLNDFDNN